MVQGRVLFGAEFRFFFILFFLSYISKIIIQVLITIIIISEVLEHMFYSIKMANRSPFRCPKVPFGPFRWLKSFSVFSRTGKDGTKRGRMIISGISGIHVPVFNGGSWVWQVTESKLLNRIS